ncbi:GNAT family N-acetyltransferase [Paenibacillus sacheonensis]|uniref:GNAT family N-acetyltransferase n=1 Tax=Paenibacillus sacheonensis TaxID=742054 RepID=A0A7X4YRD5_9BACL|nr:GNAT family N-acetyltransferase [Paenibacillus sacheonensis]
MLEINELAPSDMEHAEELFRRCIPYAFEEEGLVGFHEEIQQELVGKRHRMHDAFTTGTAVRFLVARMNDTIVGIVSSGPCNADIVKCAGERLKHVCEIGSIYVLPDLQGQGIASALIHAMAGRLAERGIDRFCLDSGFRKAQAKWMHKFGPPCATVQDYWGPGSVHMIWDCSVADFAIHR